jgi:biofilm PGA synthesis N-glycosyltransferase PgaC
MRWGRGKYFMGSALPYVIAVSAYRMFERPYFISGAGIFWGYLRAMLLRQTRHNDPAYFRHLRQYEWRSLLLGKRRTMNSYHTRIRKNTPPPPERYSRPETEVRVAAHSMKLATSLGSIST